MMHQLTEIVLSGLSQLPNGFSIIQLGFQVQKKLNVVFGEESIAVRPPLRMDQMVAFLPFPDDVGAEPCSAGHRFNPILVRGFRMARHDCAT